MKARAHVSRVQTDCVTTILQAVMLDVRLETPSTLLRLNDGVEIQKARWQHES